MVLLLIFLSSPGLHLQQWPKIVLENTAHCNAGSASSAAMGGWLWFHCAFSSVSAFGFLAVDLPVPKKYRDLSGQGNLYLLMAEACWKVNFMLTVK